MNLNSTAMSLGYHTFKRWPMDVYRISCASWVTISRSLKFSNLWRKVRTVWRQRTRFRLGIGAIFHSDHNERRAPPCVRYTCNVHSESENKSQMICESRRLLWLVIWSWRPISKHLFSGPSFLRLFSQNEDVDCWNSIGASSRTTVSVIT